MKKIAKKDILQFIKFGIVGASNTLIGLGVYYLCFYLIGLSAQVSNLIGFIISVINAYIWNLRWVFKADNSRRTIIKFFTIYTSSYLISAGLLHLWTVVLGINEGIAPILSLFITIPYNFTLSKLWAFKPSGQGRGNEKTS